MGVQLALAFGISMAHSRLIRVVTAGIAFFFIARTQMYLPQPLFANRTWLSLVVLSCLLWQPLYGQETEEESGYQFKDEVRLPCTEVKSQDATGTCWCFAAASFIESEMARMGKEPINISEMFIVKNVYQAKAENYVLRHGKANFSEGALAHDFMNAAHRYGLVPESAYSGLLDEQTFHDHSELAACLTGMLKALVNKKGNPSDRWDDAYEAVLDCYLGEAPEQFEFQGEMLTPQQFAEKIGFDAKQYVNVTSFTHHPFGESFVLEIPDNFSNGSFHNVPLDRLVEIADEAIENGYTVAWDGDVSESSFAAWNGLAVLPEASAEADALAIPGEEIEVTQAMRQETFFNHTTTDDHLMHLVGTARDQRGTKYYIIKNSWGAQGPYGGYLYMSESYFRLKTIALTVHQDVLNLEQRSAN